MTRGVVSRMSAAGGSGYPYNQVLYIDPDNNDNPTTGTETAGAYLYKWDHDNSGDEWHAPMNTPFQLDWNAAENLPTFHVQPFSTGARLTVGYYPVSPQWCQDAIASLGLTQSGTLGSYDKYPLAVGNFAEYSVNCGGVQYNLDTLVSASLLLWTADNDLHAAIFVDMTNTADDSSLESALAAANPDLWSTNNFYVAIKLKTV